jgi:hypothetical protein
MGKPIGYDDEFNYSRLDEGKEVDSWQDDVKYAARGPSAATR